MIDEDDDASILTLDTTSRNLVADMDASQMILEIDALKNEKELIEEELVEISDLLLSKQSDLEKLEEEAEERRATLYAEIEKQEKQRDELAEEVAQMKRRLNLLASESVSTKDSGETEGMKLARELGKSLGEERARCDELEMKCESLQQRIQMSEENNNTLLLANIRLQEELRKLKQQTKHGKAIEANDELSVHLSHVSEGSSEEGKEENDGGVQMQIDTTASEERLRAKAREILEMAEAARDAASPGKASICSSMAYSVGTELLFKYGDDEKEDHASLESLSPHGQVMISGLETVREDNERCACETNIFAGQAEHVEFYLPQLGVACSCGKRQTFADDCDPSSLASILRPWQFEFLQSVGINDPVEFVHAFHQRGAVLAKQMRSWRRQKKLLSVKTKSCLIALHIWSRTCRAVIRSIRQQQAQGIEKPQRPDFLEINLSDNNTVSTLGLASAYQYK